MSCIQSTFIRGSTTCTYTHTYMYIALTHDIHRDGNGVRAGNIADIDRVIPLVLQFHRIYPQPGHLLRGCELASLARLRSENDWLRVNRCRAWPERPDDALFGDRGLSVGDSECQQESSVQYSREHDVVGGENGWS